MGGAPQLVTLAPGVAFEPTAAASFLRLVRALGRIPDVNRTYADYGTQLAMYNAWQAWISGRGPKPNHSRALHPDYSMHCRGLAWDTDDWTTPGFIALAAEHGFIRTAASDPTEQHHFEYQWQRDAHRLDPTPRDIADALPKPPPTQEDDMQSIRVDKTHLYGVAPQFITHYGDTTQATITRQVTSAADELHELTSTTFNALLDGLGIPRAVVYNGTVLSPESGKHEKNGTWSREREILAKLQ